MNKVFKPEHILTPHELQVKEIINSVNCSSDKSYTIKGRDKTVYNKNVIQSHNRAYAEFGKNQSADFNSNRQRLLNQLAADLYTVFYCGLENFDQQEIPPLEERNKFMDLLSEYNCSGEGLDRGWRIYSLIPGSIPFAVKKGVLRPVYEGTYVNTGHNLTVNSIIDFYRRKEMRNSQPVFYYVYSDEFYAPSSSTVRIYWNIKPEGAPHLVKAVTSILNTYLIPFSFKCLNHPDLYNRKDGAVLYISKHDWHLFNFLLASIMASTSQWMIDQIPMFTDSLGPGIAFAEDPNGDQSFGMSRALVLAEALIRAYEKSISDPGDRFEFVKEFLSEKGVFPLRMSINPQTRLEYYQGASYADS